MSDEELIQRLGSQHTAAIARLNASNVIDDLKPCPSCREPLDHPSGDGCANMTAHKERAMSDDKELIARLRSKRQKGNRFDSLEYEAAARIEALTDKLAKAEAGLLAIAKRDEQMIWGEDYEVEEAFKDMRDISCATLAEIKGESYE